MKFRNKHIILILGLWLFAVATWFLRPAMLKADTDPCAIHFWNAQPVTVLDSINYSGMNLGAGWININLNEPPYPSDWAGGPNYMGNTGTWKLPYVYTFAKPFSCGATSASGAISFVTPSGTYASASNSDNNGSVGVQFWSEFDAYLGSQSPDLPYLLCVNDDSDWYPGYVLRRSAPNFCSQIDQQIDSTEETDSVGVNLNYPYFSSTDSDLVTKEDAVINDIAQTGNIHAKIGDSLTVPVPATNCKYLSNNGGLPSRKIVLMRSIWQYSNSKELNDFVANATSFRDSISARYPNTQFYLDLKKQDPSTFTSSSSSCGGTYYKYLFVDAPPKVITVGRLFSGINNKIFDWVDGVISPMKTVRIPVRSVSTAKTSALLTTEINKALDMNESVLVIGHSMGSIITYDVIKQRFVGDRVSGLYVDPPYNFPLCKLKLLDFLSGPFHDSNWAVCNGIAADPSTVDWTGGNAFSHLITHTPFEFPTFNSTNINNLSNLAQTIKMKLSVPIPGSSTLIPETPLVSPPSVTGTVPTPPANVKPSVAPGKTMTLTGTGFDPESNTILIENENNPDIYYEIFDQVPDAQGNLTFTLPWNPEMPNPYDSSTYPPETVFGAYTLKVAGVDSDWSEPIHITVSGCVRMEGTGPDRVVFMEGKNYSSTVGDFYLAADSVVTNGFKSVDPYKAYQNKFSYYVDFKKVEDAGIVSPKICQTRTTDPLGFWCDDQASSYVNSSSCLGVDGITPSNTVFVYLNHNNQTSGIANIINKIVAVDDKKGNFYGYTLSGVVMHELSHVYGGLSDEYCQITSNQHGTNTCDIQGACAKNCSTKPSWDYRAPDNRIYASYPWNYGCQAVYPQQDSKGQPILYVRPSLNSAMRNQLVCDTFLAESRFNVIDCGYVVAGILGNSNGATQESASKHWPVVDMQNGGVGCAAMDTVKDNLPAPTAAPTLTASPKSSSPASFVTVTGSGFSVNDNAVHLINSVTGAEFDIPGISSSDGKSFTFSLPSNLPAGTYSVKVGSFNSNWSASTLMTVTASALAPTIASVSPTSGPPGTSVTIIGSGFTASGNIVRFSSNSTNPSVRAKSQQAAVGTLSAPYYDITGLSSSDGTHLVLSVPYGSAGSYTIQAKALNSQWSSSFAMFSITGTVSPVTISVTSPRGGETWLRGSSHVLSWTTSPSSSVDLFMVNVSTSQSYNLITNFSGTSGNWVSAGTVQGVTIPDGNYVLKVCVTGTSSCNQSAGSFGLVSLPPVTVTAPNGGEVWQRGTSHVLSWTTSPSSSVDLFMVNVSTSQSYNLITNFSGTSGNWVSAGTVQGVTIPDGNYVLKVCVTGTATCDSSDNPFTVYSKPSPAPVAPASTVSENGRSTSLLASVESALQAIKRLMGKMVGRD